MLVARAALGQILPSCSMIQLVIFLPVLLITALACGLDDVARAAQLNAEWDSYRQGPHGEALLRYPRGSVGDGYEHAIELREAQRAAKGIIWTSEQRSRDDWPRAWRWIEPVFGDVDPKTVTPDLLLDFRTLVMTRVSENEAHRVIKVWHALWKKMTVLGLCALDRDPSLLFVNSAPAPRQALWTEGEAVWLVKRAWRESYRGLAALLAVAWDSQLSPVDVRHLRAQDMRSDHLGVWFDVARAKTGRKALATVSRRAHKMLAACLKTFAAEPVGRAPIFRNRSGAPSSADGTRWPLTSAPGLSVVSRNPALRIVAVGRQRHRPCRKIR